MVLRTANRAVTPEDFAFLAIETPGAQIARAKAFPLLNPNFRMLRSAVDGSAQAEVPAPGAVTVVVVPTSTDPKPMPTDGTLSLVAQWLDQHRLLTAELFVAPPRYRLTATRRTRDHSPGLPKCRRWRRRTPPEPCRGDPRVKARASPHAPLSTAAAGIGAAV